MVMGNMEFLSPTANNLKWHSFLRKIELILHCIWYKLHILFDSEQTLL